MLTYLFKPALQTIVNKVVVMLVVFVVVLAIFNTGTKFRVKIFLFKKVLNAETRLESNSSQTCSDARSIFSDIHD